MTDVDRHARKAPQATQRDRHRAGPPRAGFMGARGEGSPVLEPVEKLVHRVTAPDEAEATDGERSTGRFHRTRHDLHQVRPDAQPAPRCRR